MAELIVLILKEKGILTLNIIEAKGLTFQYEENSEPVLKQVDLEICEGEFVAVLGHNGSGKSTLAKHLNGICLPTSGKLTVAGISVCEENLSQLRRTVGMVFQNPDNQLVTTIVAEDVAFALENTGVPYEEMHQRVAEALRIVGMESFASHATHQLSGGQKQRVAIAGVIAMQPRILVLDEPTAMLDPRGRQEVMAVIRRFREQGMTIVLITHFMDEAAQADRVVVMDDGDIVLDGSPHYVFQNAGYLWSIGLDVPQSTDLMFRLRSGGLKVPLAVLTEEECVSVVEDILNGKVAWEDE